MNKLFLLDAYALIYRAYYALIKAPRINSKGVNTSAILGFVNILEEILTKESPTHIGIAFDPKGGTFRHKLFKEYKAQREETPEVIRMSVPIIKEIIKAYNIPILEVEDFEADDVIGTLALMAKKTGGIDTYMMTPDKDYCQLVSDHVYIFRPQYGDKGFDILSAESVKQKYEISDTSQIIDILGLMGDSADNIPGCPGIGLKTAQKLISEFGSIENLLANTDRLKGSLKERVEANKDKIRFSKLLATIRTDVPIELDMDLLRREKPDEEKLRSLFEELEFRSLIKRVISDNYKVITSDSSATSEKEKIDSLSTKAKDDGFHGDLFDIFQDSDKEKNKNSNLRDIKSTEHVYHLVENEAQIELIVKKISESKFVSFDTETTGINPISSQIVGLSLSVKEHEAFYIPMFGTQQEKKQRLNLLRSIFEDENIDKIGQNIKYDILILKNYDIDVKGKLFDTMVAHYLIQPELHHGMDYLAEIYLKYNTIKIEELIGEKGRKQKNMSELEYGQIYEYACEDADITLQLWNILKEELKKHDVEKLFYEVEMPLTRVLAYMERNGVRIDTKSLKETSILFNERMKDLEKQIFELAGTSFNILSPKQVGEILFDKMKIVEKPRKTKNGQYVTSEEVLEGLKDTNPIVNLLLKYRGLKKLVGTYVDSLPELINPKTGKIHTSYNQTITATGRLSSSNPNLQNIPVRDEDGKEVRKAFIPDYGCLFFSADYSQIELRIMAHLSGDENMIADFKLGHDIHAATAAKVFHKSINEISKTERNKAKTANFGIIYGISAFGLSQRLDISRTEAKKLIDDYFLTYPGIKNYIDNSIIDARNKGYIETILHRRRFLSDINSHNSTVRGFAERNAINAPIQGSAADIIKIAMINIYNRFTSEGIKSTMILQVHDELNFNVVKGEEQKVSNIVIEEMQNAYKMSVPLIADSGWGNNWLEAH